MYMLCLYLPNLFPFAFGSVGLPLIPESGVHRICQKYQQRQAPDQCDGVKEVGISRSCVDPKVVEDGPEQRCIEHCCQSWKSMAVGGTHCKRSAQPQRMNASNIRSNRWPSRHIELSQAPASPTFAYGWNTAMMPIMSTTAANGCFRKRRQNGTL